MGNRVSEEGLDLLFNQARSHSKWREKPVPESLLYELYDLMKMGPTAANACPARLVFVTTESAKNRLAECMDPGNVEKTNTAPVVAIIGMDLEFYERLTKLFPHEDARAWYVGKPDKIQETAFRNSSLQGAYFIIAARALGLDCGPMSGFDKERLQQEFFSGRPIEANFVCALGYGDVDKLYPRHPRLEFDEACEIV